MPITPPELIDFESPSHQRALKRSILLDPPIRSHLTSLKKQQLNESTGKDLHGIALPPPETSDTTPAPCTCGLKKLYWITVASIFIRYPELCLSGNLISLVTVVGLLYLLIFCLGDLPLLNAKRDGDKDNMFRGKVAFILTTWMIVACFPTQVFDHLVKVGFVVLMMWYYIFIAVPEAKMEKE